MAGKKVNVVDHPVLKHKLGYLRDKNTSASEFRSIMKEMSRLLAYEATKDCAVVDDVVETPLATSPVVRIAEPPIVVSIMRAGNGMLEGIMSMLPFASAGHIGIYRDKFIKNTVEYYFKLPEKSRNVPVILADPLLATADTAIACIDRLKTYQVGQIKMLCILASPSGIDRMQHFHPDVEIITCNIEEGLDDNGYLLPGIGDAGDRLYGTR